MPVLEKVLVPYLQHFAVNIKSRSGFHYDVRGQFYPPSAKSLDYYVKTYAGAHGVTEKAVENDDSTTVADNESASESDADSTSAADDEAAPHSDDDRSGSPTQIPTSRKAALCREAYADVLRTGPLTVSAWSFNPFD